MSFITADRVKEQSTTTGTGTYSLGGGVPVGFRGFVSGIGTGNYCDYAVDDGTNWEVGIGLVTSGAPDTLARTVVLASSNANAAVSWGAGTKTIYCAPTAANRNPKTKKLTADHAVTGVTGTEITGLKFANLVPGTYQCTYFLINQSGTSTTGVGIGINFSGTATRQVFNRRNVSTIVTAANGVTNNETTAAVVTGDCYNAWASRAFSTTTPSMMAEGVGVISTDLLDIVEVLIIVSAIGDLQIWHSSQIAATTTTVMIGSGAILTRIDD